MRSTSFRLSVPTSALALAIVLIAPFAAAAQTPALARGSVLIGGSAGVNITDDDSSENTTTLALSPTAQFFVANGFALGGELGLNYAKRGDFHTSIVGIGPAATYYFVQEGNAHPFLRASARIARVSVSGPIVDDHETRWGARAAAGLLVLLTGSVGIDLSVYYDHQSFGDDDGPDVNNYGLAVGVSAFVF
jgi:hypothetical protein